jgi:hypothetical protein
VSGITRLAGKAGTAFTHPRIHAFLPRLPRLQAGRHGGHAFTHPCLVRQAGTHPRIHTNNPLSIPNAAAMDVFKSIFSEKREERLYLNTIKMFF